MLHLLLQRLLDEELNMHETYAHGSTHSYTLVNSHCIIMVTFTPPFLRLKIYHSIFNYIFKVLLNRVIFGLKTLLTLSTLKKCRHTLEQKLLGSLCILLEGGYANLTGIMGRRKLGCILMVTSEMML